MLNRIEETIANYSMLSRGARAGVAVSGGADSVALLEALRELAPKHEWTLVVLHLNHGLRGAASDADEQFVRDLAGELHLDVRVERAALQAGPGLEEAGREARRAFFARAMQDLGLNRVATGHTRSDQAETVLFRLLRGTGPAGLSAILPVTGEGLVRPLLEISREEITAWLGARGRAWREDESNADPSFARNRIRHRLLPQLSREWNPRLVESLAGAACVARDEEIYWASVVQPIADKLFTPRRGGGRTVSCRLLAAQPPALQRRLIRWAAPGLSFTEVERIRALCLQPEGDGRVALSGIDVMRSFDQVLFSLPLNEPPPRNWSVPLDGPGRYSAPNGSCAIRCLSSPPSGAVFRNWRPGDCFDGRRLKEYFQEWCVPLWDRRDWPVLAAGENLLWARGFSATPPLAVEEILTDWKES